MLFTAFAMAMQFPNYPSTEYNYQNAFQNLVYGVKRSNCLYIFFGNSMFA